MARTIPFARCSDCDFMQEGGNDTFWAPMMAKITKEAEEHAVDRDHSVTISYAVFKDVGIVQEETDDESKPS